MSEEKLKKQILSGKIFIYPTDTIYGIGCDATNKEAVEKMKVFVKSYRFLFHLQNNVKEKEIRDKISNYLKNINNIYVESVKLLEKLDSRIEYGKHRYKQKLFDLMLENIKIVDDLIDSVFPLGRVVKLYDPETDTSYIHQ